MVIVIYLKFPWCALPSLTFFLFLGRSGFMYFHFYPHPSPPFPLYIYASTYQIAWCRSLIAVVIFIALFLSLCYPLSLSSISS